MSNATWFLVGALALNGCGQTDGDGNTGVGTSAATAGESGSGSGGGQTGGGGPGTASEGGQGACVAGAVASCTCDGGGEGSQSCMPSGDDFFPCFCGGTDGNADAGDVGSTGAAETTAGESSGSGGGVGNAPVATITHPGDGDQRPINNNIPFDGTGLDEQDGILMGDVLVWTSDLEGELGTGANIQVPLTMLGAHQITLTVTDTDGNEGTDTIVVNAVP